MTQIQSILCPIDFSEFSTNAYEYAESLACHYKARLLLQHVLYSMKPFDWWNIYPESYEESYQRLRNDAERKLQEFVRQYAKTKIQPDYYLQDGSVTDLILALAEDQAVNLIVMGTHGLRGVDWLMLGSVTEKVLRRSPCPVLAVRKPPHHLENNTHDAAPLRLQEILVCIDFSDNARHAATYAFSMAREYSAELTWLHVLEHFPGSTDLQSATSGALKQLEQAIGTHAQTSHRVALVVRVRKPYQQIIQLALEMRADLVVMGVRGCGMLDRSVFGSTTYRVAQLGSCPVLAVHM